MSDDFVFEDKQQITKCYYSTDHHINLMELKNHIKIIDCYF